MTNNIFILGKKDASNLPLHEANSLVFTVSDKSEKFADNLYLLFSLNRDSNDDINWETQQKTQQLMTPPYFLTQKIRTQLVWKLKNFFLKSKKAHGDDNITNV